MYPIALLPNHCLRYGLSGYQLNINTDFFHIQNLFLKEKIKNSHSLLQKDNHQKNYRGTSPEMKKINTYKLNHRQGIDTVLGGEGEVTTRVGKR